MEDNKTLSEETTKVENQVENINALNNGVSENSDANNENVNDVEFSDTKKAEETPSQKVEESKPQKVSTQDNSQNARRRREAERQKELKKVRYDAIKEAVDGVNPFTNKPINDDLDIEEYLTMKEIQKNGGNPLSDYSQFSKDKLKAEAQAEAEAEKKKEEQEVWFENDYKDFKTKHPEVDLEELGANESFKAFAESQVGAKPMSEIYERYQELVSRVQKEQSEKQARQVANAKASPGSLTSSETDENVFYTREQVKQMSQEEVHKNYDKVRESMARWT